MVSESCSYATAETPVTQLVEAVFNLNEITPTNVQPNPIYNPKPINSTPMLRLPKPLPKIEPKNNLNFNNQYRRNTFPIKRITQAQMEEMRSKELCYYYDVAHRCS